jgi:hypothetical protein
MNLPDDEIAWLSSLHKLLIYLAEILRALSLLLVAVGVWERNAAHVVYGLVAFYIGVWFRRDLTETE